jgi:hypothetical protein
MRRETEMFVQNIIREDRSIMDFIDARYSFINERLARHYGVPDVSGPEFRRVDLSATPRGGVVTQGSVLTVSSYATRTSPVLRGKWILDNLLDAPPPPPPGDVPNLDEAAIGTSASLREQLESHRKDPICASCHRRMAPHNPRGEPRGVRQEPHQQAPHLCAGPGPRTVRHPDGEADRLPAARRRLPVLRSRAGNRQQPALPIPTALIRGAADT